MILQYLSKVPTENKGEVTVETIRDNVEEVTVVGDEIKVLTKEPKNITVFSKKDKQIYNMWLLNDNFKTLKRLI